jgi:hypothetical protein
MLKPLIRPPLLLRAGRKDFAVGLFWQPALKSGLFQARALAKGYSKADHYIKTKGGTGLTALRGIRHKKTYSLAVLAQQYFKENTIAICKLNNDMYWIVAVINQELSVLSDVTGKAAHIRQIFHNLMGIYGEGAQIFAPPELALAEKTLDWLTLIPDKLPENARLKTLSLARYSVGGAFLLVVLWLLLHAHTVYMQYQQKVDSEKKRIQEQAALQQRQQIRPWQHIITMPTFLTQCQNVYRPLPVNIVGWSFKVAECRQDGIIIAYQHDSTVSSIADFSAQLEKRWHIKPTFNIKNGGKIAEFSIPFSEPARTAYTTEALNQSDSVINVVSFFQMHNQPFSIDDDNSLQKKTLTWKSVNFSLSHTLPPAVYFAHFPISGVRLSSLIITLADGQLKYTTKGTIYEMR